MSFSKEQSGQDISQQETNKNRLSYLIGKEVNLYYKTKNISATLESVDYRYGHATLILNQRVTLPDGKKLTKGMKVIAATEEITPEPIKFIKAPKIVQHISQNF